jgi:uroporphyrinogen III methyltransferase/synthase
VRWTPDFFTRELDQKLLCDEADVAVHSAKDIPCPLPSGLEVFALLASADPADVLVSRDRLRLEELPSGARVGTSSRARRNALLQLRPDLQVISVRGTIGERIAQVDSGHIDALIVAACALKRLGLDERIAEILPFDTHPLQGHLAIVGRSDRPDLKALFASADVRRRYGRVTLVGFGPGSPDLLTLAGNEALAQADVIFHDDLVDKAFLKRYPGTKVDVGKRKDIHRFRQEEINQHVYRAAVAGHRVVRLKGGDPMIFAHGREEIDFMQSRMVETAVVPGISSGIALSAATKIPLTHRGVASSVAFVTGHAGVSAPVPNADTLVYYMSGANIASIAERLIASGRREDLPVVLAFNVSLPDGKVYFSTLGELQYAAVRYPTPILMLAGETAGFGNDDRYSRPTLLTGTSASDCAAYTCLTHTPLIRIEKMRKNPLLEQALKAIRTFDWLIFTSRYGVRAFFELCRRQQWDIRTLSGLRIASIGRTTSSELARHGIYPDLQPLNESAEGLAQAFAAQVKTPQQVLLPRSDRGLNGLPDALTAQGHIVASIPVYRNRPCDASPVDLSRFEQIIFTSPSGVDAFIRLYGALPEGVLLTAKGKTTGNKLKAETECNGSESTGRRRTRATDTRK